MSNANLSQLSTVMVADGLVNAECWAQPCAVPDPKTQVQPAPFVWQSEAR
jgi:hypothetical protein